MSEGSEFYCFEAQWEKQRWPKVFVLTREVRSICVSTDERSFLEGETQWEGQGNRLGMSQEDLRQIFEFVVYSVLDR